MAQTIGQWLLCLKHYGLMCVLLSSPERLPYNPLCTLISLFAYLLIGWLLVDEQLGMAAVSAQIFLEVITLALLAYAGLYWKKSLPRFQQTFSALVGINLVISAVAIPVFRLVATGGEDTSDINSLRLVAELLIVIWNLAVLSLILKRAFAISTQLSAIMSFNYYLVYQFLVIWFF
jgi:hypothetical protein